MRVALITAVLLAAGTAAAQEDAAGEAPTEAPSDDAPQSEGPQSEGPQSEGPQSEGPQSEEESPSEVREEQEAPGPQPESEGDEEAPGPQRIERIESADADEGSIERVEAAEVNQDDLPPALRMDDEVAAAPPPPEDPAWPFRIFGSLSTGVGFHLNARDEFQQGALAPAYLSLRGGIVLPGRGRLRHGPQLALSTNLSQEGTYPSGVLPFRQWVLVPSYALRIGLQEGPLPQWLLTGRVGVPLVLSPDVSVGAELAVGAQYFARAGFGVFAELIYDVYVGGRLRDGSRATHHVLTLEVGVQFELEALP